MGILRYKVTRSDVKKHHFPSLRKTIVFLLKIYCQLNRHIGPSLYQGERKYAICDVENSLYNITIIYKSFLTTLSGNKSSHVGANFNIVEIILLIYYQLVAILQCAIDLDTDMSACLAPVVKLARQFGHAMLIFSCS